MTNQTNRPVEIGQGEVWLSDRERFEATATPEQLELADALTKRLEELGHHDIASRRALLLDLVTGVIARHAASAREEGFRAGVEAAAKLADDLAEGSAELLHLARQDKDRVGGLLHSGEVDTARTLSARIRSLSIAGRA